MELCCLVGGALALLMMVFRVLRCTVVFAMLWVLYLSVYKVRVWETLLQTSNTSTLSMGAAGVVYYGLCQVHEYCIVIHSLPIYYEHDLVLWVHVSSWVHDLACEFMSSWVHDLVLWVHSLDTCRFMGTCMILCCGSIPSWVHVSSWMHDFVLCLEFMDIVKFHGHEPP